MTDHRWSVYSVGRAVRASMRDPGRRIVGYEAVCSCGWRQRVNGGGRRAAERAAREHARSAG